MKKYSLLLLFTLLVQLSFAQTKSFIDKPYIEVRGKAKMEIVPNEIYVQIVLHEKENKGKRTVEQLEKSLLKELKKFDVDTEKDLRVVDFAGTYQKHWLKSGEMVKSKEYELLLHSAENLGAIFKKLDEMGISQVNVTRVHHSDLEKFRLEAKVEAVKAGKNKANAMMNALNQKCGNALYVEEIINYEESAGNYRHNKVMARGMASFDGPEMVPNVEFKKIELKYEVLIRFEIL